MENLLFQLHSTSIILRSLVIFVLFFCIFSKKLYKFPANCWILTGLFCGWAQDFIVLFIHDIYNINLVSTYLYICRSSFILGFFMRTKSRFRIEVTPNDKIISLIYGICSFGLPFLFIVFSILPVEFHPVILSSNPLVESLLPHCNEIIQEIIQVGLIIFLMIGIVEIKLVIHKSVKDLYIKISYICLLLVFFIKYFVSNISWIVTSTGNLYNFVIPLLVSKQIIDDLFLIFLGLSFLFHYGKERIEEKRNV